MGLLSKAFGLNGGQKKQQFAAPPIVQTAKNVWHHFYPKKTGKNGNGATAGSSAAYSEDSPYYQR